jgi:hypothetical protein
MNKHRILTLTALLVAFVTSASSQTLAPRTWTSTGPVVVPTADANHPIVSVKDPTVVYDGGRWHVFTTTANKNGAWSMAYFNFTSWDQAPQAKPFYLEDNPNLRGYNAAPQVFYFRPQGKWYLIFQSGNPRYSTTTDIANPMSWSVPKDFFPSTPSGVVNGWLDFWIICDDTRAYLFAPDDHGRFYRSSTTLANFPNGFSNPVIAMQAADASDLFEGSCVYKLKGSNQYLCLVECVSHSNGHRYYRAFTSNQLDGTWQALAGANSETSPFAGDANVSMTDGSTLWCEGISHGELLRDGSDETMTVDPAGMQFLYQGFARGVTASDYYLLPYRLGLLTTASVGSGGPVANGTYRIIARHSGKGMDALNAGTANGTQIIQWTYGGGNNQRWTVTDRGNNQKSIIGVQSGRAIEVSNWGTANGSKVQLWDWLNGTNQKYTFTATSGGYYRITPVHASGSCLDVAGVSTADGALVHLWSYGGANNQQWAFQAP